MQDQHANHIQALDKAIKLIQEAWCKYVLSRRRQGKTHYCLLGAIDEAVQDESLGADLKSRIAEKIGEIGEDRPYMDLGDWNDCQGTKAPVIKLLKEVKEELEVQAK